MSKLTFTYFYTNPPFWAGEEPNWDSLEPLADIHDYFSTIVSDLTKDGLTVRVVRDGMIEIRYDKIESKVRADDEPVDFQGGLSLWNEYLKLCNIYNLILDGLTVKMKNFAQFNFKEITSNEASRTTYEGATSTGSGIPPNSIVGHYFMQRYRSSHRPGLPLRASFFSATRWPLSLELFTPTFDLFYAVIASDSLSEYVFSLSKAVCEFKKTNFRLTIVLCWFVVEAVLKDRYSEYLANLPNSNQRINSDRRNFLEGRDVTAGVMSNILELVDIINIDELRKIDKLRQLRNDVAHSINKKEINMAEARDSLSLVATMIFSGTGLELPLNLSISTQTL